MIQIKDWTPEYFVANQSTCKLILEQSDVLNEIPLLNNVPKSRFKHKQLVKFRGMIQDMYNPEYYFEQYEIKNKLNGFSEVRCGMYTDSAHCLENEEIIMESDKNKSAERQTCVVISIPGLNNWAKETRMNSVGYNDSTTNDCNPNKRSLSKDDKLVDSSEPVVKKEKLSSDIRDEESNITAENKHIGFLEEHILNFPIPIHDGKACIVKIYDEVPLKLNQVIDVIGFISLDPVLNINDEEDTMDNDYDDERNIYNPPVLLVPRLHAIKVFGLTKHNIDRVQNIVFTAESVREDLHTILSQLLFGDRLAANYLICHLISSVYMRKDYICLGNFPINITTFSVDKCRMFPKQLYDILTLFVRKSHFLEVTLENLNNLTFVPKKDYECNRLTSGTLQLSDNTHLVIDETKLNSGQISQAGMQNYGAIDNLIKSQKVTYDFKYYTIDYDTDIPVLILSEAKSLIPCPIQVVLKPDKESEDIYLQIVEAVKYHLKDENRLANIRQYLEVARDTEFVLNEDIANIIQEDFVQLRQANQKVTTENLHSLIVLARLMSLSHGKNSLTIEYWKEAVRMETERMNRLTYHNK